MTVERWKTVVGYEGLYEVSDYGRVKSLDKITVQKSYHNRQRQFPVMILSPSFNRQKYHVVTLTKNRKKKTHLLHRLVAKAFMENPEKKRCINHKDMDKINNYVSNLEWCTHQENHIHSFIHSDSRQGKNHHNSKLSDNDVREIRRLLPTKKINEVAKIFQVHRTTISDIKYNRTWRKTQ